MGGRIPAECEGQRAVGRRGVEVLVPDARVGAREQHELGVALFHPERLDHDLLLRRDVHDDRLGKTERHTQLLTQFHGGFLTGEIEATFGSVGGGLVHPGHDSGTGTGRLRRHPLHGNQPRRPVFDVG